MRNSNTFERTLELSLVIMFVLYPKVTMVAFEGFPCYWFEPVGDAPARGWLRADVSIECTTEEHASLTTVAWTAVVIYPVGLFFGCLVMLWKASTAIVSDKPTPFSRSISFLYREYKVKTYWWELMEMLRKFLLIGLLVTIEPGSVIQIVMGTVVCATYLMVQLQAQPYAKPFDNYVAQGSSFSMLMFFFCCVLYKYDSLTASDDLKRKMSSEQKDDFLLPSTLLATVLLLSVAGSLGVAASLVVIQIGLERRLESKTSRPSTTSRPTQLAASAGPSSSLFVVRPTPPTNLQA